jgi:hypothetical protein
MASLIFVSLMIKTLVCQTNFIEEYYGSLYLRQYSYRQKRPIRLGRKFQSCAASILLIFIHNLLSFNRIYYQLLKDYHLHQH